MRIRRPNEIRDAPRDSPSTRSGYHYSRFWSCFFREREARDDQETHAYLALQQRGGPFAAEAAMHLRGIRFACLWVVIGVAALRTAAAATTIIDNAHCLA
jgi:hypothetical protein